MSKNMTKEDIFATVADGDINDFATSETVTDGDITLTDAVIFGNDEMFDLDRFYQYVAIDGTLYKAYYNTDDIALDEIDYNHAEEIVELDVNDWIKYGYARCRV